jgi:Sulfotransferase family
VRLHLQLKQKHHVVHPRSRSKHNKPQKTHHQASLKPAASYLVPNPKFHHANEKSSANGSSTVAVELDAHLTTTVNPVYEYSEEINAKAEKDFNERRMHLWEVCERSKIVGKFTPNAWEFFISPGHGLAWCNVFKAASTTWMYYFNLLGESPHQLWFHAANPTHYSWLR